MITNTASLVVDGGRRRIALSLMLVCLYGCGGGSSSSPAPVGGSVGSTPVPPGQVTINRASTYSVDVTYDLIYGQGLSHSDWNAANPVTVDLLLDVYVPNNEATLRPALVFIHGGGFRGGNKLTAPSVAFASYFAERGFVGVAINYRLEGQFGTIPGELNSAVDALVGLSSEQRNQIKAMYPATRDAKAAIRWLRANAEIYGIDPDHIAVAGGSAGSFISVALGVTSEGDFTSELSAAEDSTLAATHLEQSSAVQVVVDHWGGPGTVELIAETYGVDPWDAGDAPLSIVHGTDDMVVPFSDAEVLVAEYQRTGAPYEFYPLPGAAHSAWNALVDNQTLEALAFDFVARTLELSVIEN